MDDLDTDRRLILVDVGVRNFRGENVVKMLGLLNVSFEHPELNQVAALGDRFGACRLVRGVQLSFLCASLAGGLGQ